MIPTRVLFVDDDTALGNLVSMALTAKGYEVHFQSSLLGVESVIEAFSPSIILLDVEIGKDNGIDKAETLLAKYPDIPIIFVSSHTDSKTAIKGMNKGAKSYIRKPFDMEELEAYLKCFAQNPLLIFGNYSLNEDSRVLQHENDALKVLSNFEYRLLRLLITYRDSLVTKKQIAEKLWSKETCDAKCEATISNLISHLRELFTKDDSVNLKTIRRKGYQLTIKK